MKRGRALEDSPPQAQRRPLCLRKANVVADSSDDEARLFAWVIVGMSFATGVFATGVSDGRLRRVRGPACRHVRGCVRWLCAFAVPAWPQEGVDLSSLDGEARSEDSDEEGSGSGSGSLPFVVSDDDDDDDDDEEVGRGCGGSVVVGEVGAGTCAAALRLVVVPVAACCRVCAFRAIVCSEGTGTCICKLFHVCALEAGSILCCAGAGWVCGFVGMGCGGVCGVWGVWGVVCAQDVPSHFRMDMVAAAAAERAQMKLVRAGASGPTGLAAATYPIKVCWRLYLRTLAMCLRVPGFADGLKSSAFGPAAALIERRVEDRLCGRRDHLAGSGNWSSDVRATLSSAPWLSVEDHGVSAAPTCAICHRHSDCHLQVEVSGKAANPHLLWGFFGRAGARSWHSCLPSDGAAAVDENLPCGGVCAWRARLWHTLLYFKHFLLLILSDFLARSSDDSRGNDPPSGPAWLALCDSLFHQFNSLVGATDNEYSTDTDGTSTDGVDWSMHARLRSVVLLRPSSMSKAPRPSPPGCRRVVHDSADEREEVASAPAPALGPAPAVRPSPLARRRVVEDDDALAIRPSPLARRRVVEDDDAQAARPSPPARRRVVDGDATPAPQSALRRTSRHVVASDSDSSSSGGGDSGCDSDGSVGLSPEEALWRACTVSDS
jgi:hypothetical protein